MAYGFEAFSLSQVPREENVEADALANLGASLRIPPEIRIPINYILVLTIEDPSNKPVDPNHHDQTTNMTIIKDPDSQPLPQDPNFQDPNIQDPP